MKILSAIGLIVLGILVLRTTYNDEKEYKSFLAAGYVMHFGGYIGGFGAIVTGITLLYEVITGDHFFN